MRKPAFGRMRNGLRNLGAWVLSPLVRVIDAVATSLDSADDDGNLEWGLSWAGIEQSRWRRGPEFVDCTSFGDGYVVTTSFDDRDGVWQLTPGPVPLGSALATATLFLQYGLSPQFDNAGRPFIALDDDGPRQIFEEPDGDESVRYVYLDNVRAPEEFPDFLTVRGDVERAFKRMTPQKPGTHR